MKQSEKLKKELENYKNRSWYVVLWFALVCITTMLYLIFKS